MANSRIWSDEDKEYVRKIIKNKNVMFVTVSNNQSSDISDNTDYDIILGYNELYDVYMAADAKLHGKNKTINFGFPARYLREKDNILMRYKALDNARKNMEHILLIPSAKLDVFCGNVDYYFKYETNEEIKGGRAFEIPQP